MACFEQQSPLSVLSPLLTMDTDSFYINSPDESSKGAVVRCSPTAERTSSSTLKRSPSSLSSSKDSGASRVSKRRKSRAKPKAPVTQLSANKLNFKDIVYQFTGAPSYKHPFSNMMSAGKSHLQSATDCTVPQQLMPSAMAHGMPVTEKDALLAGALLAESLKTLDSISSYLLHPNMSSGNSNTHACNAADSRNRPMVTELEDFLLKGESKLDSFFSLSCVLLNQIATQCGALSQS